MHCPEKNYIRKSPIEMWDLIDDNKSLKMMRKFVIKKLIEITLLLILSSCMKTELLNAPEPKVVDTVVVKASRPKPPKPEEPDTTRVPIGFDVEVEDWDKKVIEL